MPATMQPVPVVASLVIFNVAVLTSIARWYVVPRLARRPRHEALVPLLLVHLIRPISMWTLVPGVIVHPTLPQAWAWSTAIGDLIATGLAIAGVLALRRRARMAIAVVWVFNVVGALDALKNGIYAAKLGVIAHMGAAALVPSYGVPILLVSHGLVFWLLLRRAEHPTPP